jgi:hypothetical protein
VSEWSHKSLGYALQVPFMHLSNTHPGQVDFM